MSLDALGPSPRRMARAPPPPVAPKRFHLKDPPQDLLHKDLRRVASPNGRKQSAVERLAADRAKYVKGGQPALPAKPQQPTRASPHPPVIRKQLVPHSCAIGSGHTKASPQRPQRKVAPTAGTQTGVPVLDLKHLTNLISGVGETTSTSSPFSTPSTSLHATSSSSQSSEGMGTGEEGGEGMTKEGRGDENIEPSANLASSSSPPTENLASTSSSSPTSPPAQLLPTSPCQSLSGMLKPDHSGPLGPPAMTVRRVDVMPQVASVRKPMQAVPQTRMQGPTQRPQTRPQSQAHLMHLLKAQLAARNAPLLPKNAPLLAGAQLNASPTGVGIKVGPTGITPRGLPGNAAPQPHLPLHQNGNGAPPTVSPTMASPKQPLEGPAHPLPQGPLTTDAGQLPVSCQQPTGRLGNPGSRITLLPSPLVLGDTGGRGSPSATAASSSPALVPSPCPSLLTRVSSTSSRKRPSLSRSKSDLSDRFSRAGADLERFFNYCGLDPTDLRQLAQPGSDIASVSVSMSRLRSASAPASERSQENADEMEEEEEEDPRLLQRTPYGISVIERNARVIKWLYGMRQARDPARVANI